jgi:hypothetical protein
VPAQEVAFRFEGIVASGACPRSDGERLPSGASEPAARHSDATPGPVGAPTETTVGDPQTPHGETAGWFRGPHPVRRECGKAR